MSEVPLYPSFSLATQASVSSAVFFMSEHLAHKKPRCLMSEDPSAKRIRTTVLPFGTILTSCFLNINTPPPLSGGAA